ncbi:hypothetical protein KKI23_03140 [Patescibacteria group bacterium]|nr:hypothetical protein [Patescibacteria group bacterium]
MLIVALFGFGLYWLLPLPFIVIFISDADKQGCLASLCVIAVILHWFAGAAECIPAFYERGLDWVLGRLLPSASKAR